MKTSRTSKPDKTPIHEIDRFNSSRVLIAGFKPQLNPEELRQLIVGGGLKVNLPTAFQPIETLNLVRTRGLGRTNLTLVQVNTFQVDATTPRASFSSPVSGQRKPVVQMHFEPGAYGVTAVGSYFMEFAIDFQTASGSGSFTLGGGGPGTLANPGTVHLEGSRRITLVFNNVPPTAQIFGFIQQESGDPWEWFSVSASFPPPVLTQG
jgi:hypothetical protein